MKPPPFRYFAARSIAEAVGRLARVGPAGKVIAGGQSLVPLLNFRFSRPSLLVDLNRIPGLDCVEPTSTGLRLGALTRHRALETSAFEKAKLPLLAEAVALIGHLATRNRGTIGGSLAHADACLASIAPAPQRGRRSRSLDSRR